MEEEIDLKEMFSYFRDRILWIFIVVGVFMIVGNVYLALIKTPMYHATTKVLVSNDAKNLWNSYAQVVRSKSVLDSVSEKVGLKSSAGLKNKIEAAQIPNTDMMEITVSYQNPKKAAEIADEIVPIFLKESQKLYKVKNVTVVEKAVADSKPYNIQFMKTNLIFLVSALALSLGIIFVLFYFDTTVKSSDDVETRLGLPVIGIVPTVEESEKRER